MKSLFTAASVLAFAAAPAFAADGQVSHRSLSNMGLAGMSAMTDAQGMHIRGLSIAVVGGSSTAHISSESSGYASSTNFYFAAGKNSASGANLSGAVSVDVDGHHTNINAVAAGGFSTAKAH